MSIIKIVAPFLMLSCFASEITFKEAIQAISENPSVKMLQDIEQSQRSEADSKHSWGDPRVMVAARNIPKESFSTKESMMSAIEFNLSQKVALSNKYQKISDALNMMAQSSEHEKNNLKSALIKELWDSLIQEEKLKNEIDVLNDNYQWLVNILKVSNKLYGNGKIPQQSILELEMRKSEIEINIANKKIDLENIKIEIQYLTNNKASAVKTSSIPWATLNLSSNSKVQDLKLLAIESQLQSKELMVQAMRRNFLPDITVSMSYLKRNDKDGMGDMVGASISFPIPTSSQTYSDFDKSVNERSALQNKYNSYKISKEREVSKTKVEMQKFQNELNLLNKKNIQFAKNSRDLVAKNYSLGSGSYMELLQADIKVRDLEMKKILLKANIDSLKVKLKYILGEALYE